MSHFDAIRAKSICRRRRSLAPGLRAGRRGRLFLQSDSMNTSRTAHIYGPGGFHEYAYIAPVKFTVFEGTGATPQTGALSGRSTWSASASTSSTTSAWAR